MINSLPNRWSILAAALPLAFTATHAGAQGTPAVTTDSSVYIERVAPDATRRLEPARQLTRGDRIITVLRWYRLGGDGGFVITNPLPASLAYQKGTGDNEEVSVDRGRTWGQLENLRIGARAATADDVTHIRWRIPSTSAARGRGEFAYAGLVR